jgi:hypothetical protein
VGPTVVFAPPPGTAHRAAETSLGAGAAPGSGEASASGAAEIVNVDPTPDRGVDLDSLTDDLYDRLEARLRQELLLERERRGTLPDAWI